MPFDRVGAYRADEPQLKRVKVDQQYITLHLTDGRIVMVPESWFPRLAHAREEDRQDFEIVGSRGVAWFSLGEDLTIEQVLQGQGSYESEASFRAWHRAYHQGQTEPTFAFLSPDAFSEE